MEQVANPLLELHVRKLVDLRRRAIIGYALLLLAGIAMIAGGLTINIAGDAVGGFLLMGGTVLIIGAWRGMTVSRRLDTRLSLAAR